MQRRVQIPCGRSHKAAHTTQPWAGHRQQKQALPSIAKAIPISDWWSWHHCLVWGGLAMRILLGDIEFLDAEKEQAHPSVLIKTTVRLPPLLLSALGKALPREYQVGRLVIFPNSGAGKWKREFLHSTRPAKGLLRSICSFRGIGGLSPSGGGGRTEYKALWGKWHLHHSSHQATSSPFSHLFPSLQLPSNPRSCFFLRPCKTLEVVPLLTFHPPHCIHFPRTFFSFWVSPKSPI